jgi:hypothetical protein
MDQRFLAGDNRKEFMRKKLLEQLEIRKKDTEAIEYEMPTECLNNKLKLSEFTTQSNTIGQSPKKPTPTATLVYPDA